MCISIRINIKSLGPSNDFKLPAVVVVGDTSDN